MQHIEKTKREFLAECADDYVGLWSLIRRVRSELSEADPQSVREIAIALCMELLRAGLIEAGIPRVSGEFEKWELSPEESIERIEREWDKLGREPNMGDIVWFTTTNEGDAYVKQSAQTN